MENWHNALLNVNISFEAAIKALNNAGLRILLLIDEHKKLQGTLTDGDIRRAILERVPLDAPVCQVMNIKPKTVQVNETKDNAVGLMTALGLLHIPVVDQEGHVVNLLSFDRLQKKKQYNNPVFIMAGGFGKRLRPLTDNCPKPMLEVHGKPILEHILMRCLESGFHRIYISTHYMPDKIQNYFQDGSKWGLSIQYTHEVEPLGTGGALGLLPKQEIDAPLLMLNGDVLTSVDFSSIVNSHVYSDAMATICVRSYEHQVPFGVIEQEKSRVTKMVEKPTYSFLVNGGIYVLNPEVIRDTKPDKKFDMPDLIQQMLDANEKTVNIFPMHESWTDVGRFSDFEKAGQFLTNSEV